MADPIYRKIAEDLRLKIDSGGLEPGKRLPTEQELGDEYNASRNTIRDAVKLLITRGLVETRPGQGTFVVNKIDPFVTTLSADPETGLGGGEGAVFASAVMEKRRTPKSTDPRVEIQKAAGVVASELHLDEDTQVVSRHQQRSIDDTLWSLQTSFYPMDLVVKGGTELIQATDIKPGTVRYLSETLGIKQAGYRDTIIVRPPDETEAVLFKLPDDGRVAMLEARRIAFDASDKPFRLTITVYPADRTRLAYNSGTVPVEFGGPIPAATDSIPAQEASAESGPGKAAE